LIYLSICLFIVQLID